MATDVRSRGTTGALMALAATASAFLLLASCGTSGKATPGAGPGARVVCDTVAARWASLKPVSVVRRDVDTIPVSDTVARFGCLVEGRALSTKAAPLGATFWSPYYTLGTTVGAPPGWEPMGFYDADGPGTLDRTFSRADVRCEVAFESDAEDDDSTRVLSDTVSERTVCWTTDAASIGHARPRAVNFAGPRCRATVVSPPGWDVQSLDSATYGSACGVRLRPPRIEHLMAAARGVDLFSITVIVRAEGVDSALARAGFTSDSGSWEVAGRQGVRNPAHELTGTGWRGMQGIASMGCDDRTGTYAGLCDEPTALVGTSERSVFVQSGPRSERQFDAVVRSVRFIASAP